MFTGIIKEIGNIRNIRQTGRILSLEITSNSIAGGIGIGDSVAVNGVCLTVVKFVAGVLTFDVMRETVRCSIFFSGSHYYYSCHLADWPYHSFAT